MSSLRPAATPRSAKNVRAIRSSRSRCRPHRRRPTMASTFSDRPIDTICLDAGGTLVWPNWKRVRDELAAQGIAVDASSLADADPRVRRSLDEQHLIAASTDQSRAWNLSVAVLTTAGVELT